MWWFGFSNSRKQDDLCEGKWYGAWLFSLTTYANKRGLKRAFQVSAVHVLGVISITSILQSYNAQRHYIKPKTRFLDIISGHKRAIGGMRSFLQQPQKESSSTLSVLQLLGGDLPRALSPSPGDKRQPCPDTSPVFPLSPAFKPWVSSLFSYICLYNLSVFVCMYMYIFR